MTFKMYLEKYFVMKSVRRNRFRLIWIVYFLSFSQLVGHFFRYCAPRDYNIPYVMSEKKGLLFSSEIHGSKRSWRNFFCTQIEKDMIDDVRRGSRVDSIFEFVERYNAQWIVFKYTIFVQIVFLVFFVFVENRHWISSPFDTLTSF